MVDGRPALRVGKNERLEVQSLRCRAPRYAALERCRACQTTSTTQSCRFRHLRQVCVDGAGVATRALPTVAEGAGFRLADAQTAGSGAYDLDAPPGSAASLARDPTQTAEERRQYELLLRHASEPLSRLVKRELQLAGEEQPAVVDPRALCHIRSAAAAERARHFGESPDGERQLCDGCGTAIFFLYRACS
eukprot:scaffold3962_cov122-Isochrysis_galbana.AAC.14